MVPQKSIPPQAGQGAQKLRSEAHLSRVSRDNDEVEAQFRFERDPAKAGDFLRNHQN